MSITYRAAAPADAPKLDAIMHASSGYASPEQRTLIESVHVDLAPRADYVGVVQEDENGVSGFYTLGRVDAEEWDLDLFFVADDRHGAGLGRALFAHAAERARSLSARRLRIVSNPAAADFYRRMGARDAGVIAAAGRFGWDRPHLVLEL